MGFIVNIYFFTSINGVSIDERNFLNGNDVNGPFVVLAAAVVGCLVAAAVIVAAAVVGCPVAAAVVGFVVVEYFSF